MDYEQKYKEALERASKLRVQNPFDTVGQMVEHIFPELAESEDERIKREILELVSIAGNGNQFEEIKDWLEKQREKNTADKVEPKFKVKYAGSEYNVFDTKDIAGVTFYGIEDEQNHIDYVKAENCDIISGYAIKENGSPYPTKPAVFSEQKPADKVEPKFKVGDWIILPLGIIAHIDSLNSTDYQVTTTDGKICDFKISKQDNYRFWTIADAKDGDVLCYHVSATNFFQIAIFKRVASKDELWGQTYRNYVQYGGFGGIENYTLQVALGDNELHHCGATACPATKEQRDLLFAKMKEAGYKWDTKKKELKKIESKMLDADKVIEWLEEHVPTKFEYMTNYVQQFKKDFGL